MSFPSTPEVAKVESIFHPSDFTEGSEVAFTHALKLALVTGAELSIMHVTADHSVRWEEFPGVRGTLERWSLLPKGSSKSAVEELGIDVRKVVASSSNPVKACLGYLEKHPADLIVLAIHPREGSMRWLERSVGEPIARGAGQMTLFIPYGIQGFVSRQDGSISLSNILIPVATKPRPEPAVEVAARLIQNLNLPPGTATLLHVGPAGEMPSVKTPDDTGWSWERVTHSGDPVEEILKTAAGLSADLIVMTTEGPHGFLDGLRGSTSERVLRKSPCPVAILPMGSLLA